MKFFIVVVCVVVAFAIFAVYVDNHNAPTPEQVQQRVTDYANSISNKITYIRDQRTDLCFAYFWYSGGPALASVPCDVVQKYLLNPNG